MNHQLKSTDTNNGINDNGIKVYFCNFSPLGQSAHPSVFEQLGVASPCTVPLDSSDVPF